MSAKCHRCNKAVNPIEKLNCLDKIWHKGCFTCKVCHMTLSMETYQDYKKLPYCKMHHPLIKFTTVADTPVVPDAKRIKLDAEPYKHGSMNNSCCIKTKDEQSIVDTQELKNTLHKDTDTNMASASYLDHKGKPLVGQVELESDKTAVSLHIDLNLSQSAPSSSSNEGPPKVAAIHDSAADNDEEKVNLLKDQTKMSDILDNSKLLLQLAIMVGKDWQKLGRFLLVSDNELDVIDADYNDMEEKAHRMFCSWKNQQKSPTINDLANAMYQINRLDLIRVMEKFSNKSFETENPLKPSIEEKEKMREALKSHYLKTYGKMDEIVHIARTPAKVELLNKFIELTVVDSGEVEKDIVTIAERELFCQRQLTYQPIEFKEVFSKELSLLLISGIAGIGKTCLLRKCLLDWANGTLWENVDLVLYLECRKLNQHQKISNIDELLKVFYKNIFQEYNVCEHFSVLFVIDGLDEFAHFDKLINHDLLNPNNLPIVNALAEALNIQKYKCVVAGRVGAISQYKYKVTECTDKLTIQIMGLNDEGVDKYIENYCNKKETIKSVLKESFYAKAMASVPFYLSAMCAVIAASGSYSFNTMTELYCSIFLYFFQNHICKTDETVHIMMQNESNKQHVLRVCKVAWELFNQGKILFSQDEMKGVVNDFDEVENELLGFIERVDSQLGYQYQFAHLTLMEFCASVHAHIYLSPEEIISNKKLLSCLPMICGLANENKRSFVRLLGNLMNSNEEKNILLNAVLDLVPKRIALTKLSGTLLKKYRVFYGKFPAATMTKLPVILRKNPSHVNGSFCK